MPPPAYSPTSRVIIYIDCVTRSPPPPLIPFVGSSPGCPLSATQSHTFIEVCITYLHHIYIIHHMLRREADMRIKCNNSGFKVFMFTLYYSEHYLSALYERLLQTWIYHNEMHIYQTTLYRVVVKIDDCV